MSKYEKINLDKIKTISILDRASKVKIDDFATTFQPNNNFDEFINSLPNILVAKDFKEFSTRFADAVINKKTICVMMGAHLIKVGLAPLIVELIKHKWISSISMNGAGVIHDVELSLWGRTSEEVAENLQNGTFGMSVETAQFINYSLKENINTDLGYGESIGKKLLEWPVVNQDRSILYNAYIHSIPATVHVGIGTDIIYQHSNMDGAAAGQLSYRDFKILCNVLQHIGNGGIVLNIGSAVILPEVFLKALTVVRNLGNHAFNFTTATFDMIHQYRPKVNVVERPTLSNGKGYYFIGHHEIMIPLLVASVKNLIRKQNGKK
jgi:deoxyhypusine synthase